MDIAPDWNSEDVTENPKYATTQVTYMVPKFNPEVNTLWLDCDGVLADFDEYATLRLGMDPRRFEHTHGSDMFWKHLASRETGWTLAPTTEYYRFFENLEPMYDAFDLIKKVDHLKPRILTGAPSQIPDAEEQKRIWIRKTFGEEYEARAIVCQSKNKYQHCKPGDVIVDDWPKHKQKWRDAGGIWVTHFQTYMTIRKLKKLGVI